MLVQWKLRFTTYIASIYIFSLVSKISNDLPPLFVSTFRQLPTQFIFLCACFPKLYHYFPAGLKRDWKVGFDRKRKQEQRDVIKVVLQIHSILRNEKNYAEQLCWAVKLDTLDDFEYGNDLRRRKSLSSSTTWPFTHVVATLLILWFTRIMYVTLLNEYSLMLLKWVFKNIQCIKLFIFKQ